MRRTILILALVVIFIVVGAVMARQPETGLDLERIQRATVFIMQAVDTGDNFYITCVGSGTVVNRNGFILTNAHNTLQSDTCPGDALIVALTIRPDEPPIPRYRADVVQSNIGLDLALLRISRQIDGRAVDVEALSLPFVELADSSGIQIDDTITVVGYPGIGNDPVTSIRGTISGFTAEPSGGLRSWVKTSASIPGTMSGGGAYNQQGELIGIPTTAPVTIEAGNSVCLRDTNNDRLVNTNDICIPLGDNINSLRPSNFARPLLRAASLGLRVTDTMDFARRSVQPSAPPQFSRLFFAPSVNEAGQPTTVLRSLPAGTNSLYLFFDYANMTPETVYALRVTTDGIPNPNFSLAPVRWSGGERGSWYLGSSGQAWPNGVYEFTLFADGIAADTARIIIGGAPDVSPTFSGITFGLLDLQGNLLGNGFVLPTGSTANAEFLFQNMVDGTPWSAIWYYNGNEIFRTPPDTLWTDGRSGRRTTSISDPNGLLPGNYRLELYIDGRLAASSDFIIAGAQEGVFPRIFANPHFTTAQSAAEAQTAPPIANFAAGTDVIYSVFDWSQIVAGTPWRLRWRIDDEIFYEQIQPWAGPDSGEDYVFQLTAPDGIPDGSYALELFVGELQIVREEARVGIGQLPIDPFSQADGVQLRGRILDADTGRGISGATFVLLGAAFSVEDFVWDDNQVYAHAITDINGEFEIPRPLQYSTEDNPIPYSAIIVASGYLPVAADGLEVTVEDVSPVEISIEMTRD